MASNNRLYLNVGNLLSLSPGDMDADDSAPRFRPGGLNFLSDAYGARIMKYVQTKAAAAKGDLLSAASAGTDQRHTAFTVQATVVNSTTAADITGATADRHIGMIAFVSNVSAGAGGVAPEGEATIVKSNTAAILRFEPKYPLSSALAVNDLLHVIATYQVEASAANDQAWKVEGVCIGLNGITSGNFGWVQQYGFVVAKQTAAAITFGNEVVAGANAVRTKGAQTGEDWVGVALATTQSDVVALALPIKVTIFGTHSGIAA